MAYKQVNDQYFYFDLIDAVAGGGNWRQSCWHWRPAEDNLQDLVYLPLRQGFIASRRSARRVPGSSAAIKPVAHF